MDPPCTGCSTSGMCWNAVNRTLCPVSVFIRFGPELVSSSLTGCCRVLSGCRTGPLQRQGFPLTDSWKRLITEATRAVCFVKCLLKILQRDPQMDSSLRQITSANLSRYTDIQENTNSAEHVWEEGTLTQSSVFNRPEQTCSKTDLFLWWRKAVMNDAAWMEYWIRKLYFISAMEASLQPPSFYNSTQWN